MGPSADPGELRGPQDGVERPMSDPKEDITSLICVTRTFSHVNCSSMRTQLDKLNTNKPPIRFTEKGRIAPALIAEIDFRGWASDKKLRHAPFKGLRDPKHAVAVNSLDVGDVYRQDWAQAGSCVAQR